MEKFEDTTAVIRENEEIIRTKKSKIIWIAYQQGIKREREREVCYDNYDNSSITLNFLKTYFKDIKEICRENAEKFQ